MTNPTTRYSHIEPEHQGKALNFRQVGPGEVEHHGGSFRKYMDNKNKKLQEQFDQQSAVAAAYGDASGHAVSNLFHGVSIMVNGFTTPSQQDLKQIMAQHGGNFEIYYHRGRVTHIICSNLTDAKVKHFQRERNPTPVVRPEWVVDSLTAGTILPLEEYVLWRLRDVPGQRLLSAFRQQPGTNTQTAEKPMHISAALPPSPYGKFSSSAAQPSDTHAQQAEPKPTALPSHPQVTTASGAVQASDAYTASDPQSGARPTTSIKALDFGDADIVHARASLMPEAELDPLSGSHDMSVLPHAAHMGQDYSHNTAASAAANGGGTAYDTRRVHDNPRAQRPQQGQPSAALHAQEVTSSGATAAAAPPAAAAAVPAADDYRVAHERAAAARAACDMLRGPPKSSRDDPHFMDSYYKSSRLSFIGRWKARIEALTASMAADAPLPKTVQQPSTLLNAFKVDKGTESGAERSIIHLDMDCFFASVASLAEPAFQGKPLAVSHSNSAQGSGEISSANYEARKFGIRASMFIAEAKKRCPHLIVMPYQFDKYEEVSEQVYRILLNATACVQPVSCDEAYLDVTGLGDPKEVAASIRQQIFEATGCTASAGIGPSMLVARLATKKGKPNGQFRIETRQVDAYLLDLEVDELPGVGWNMCQKLKELGIASVSQVRASSKDALQRELGSKTGLQVWAYAHGVDDRQVEPPKSRKSVGAECNWGIRFQRDADAAAFMDNLAGELSTRMKAAGVRGRTISLKLKRRKTNAPDPPKFMGHGDCDNMSRSITLSRFTDSPTELASQGKALLKALKVDPTQIRGIGLNVTKLDSDPASASAKPGSAAPSKVAAPPPSTHDPKTGPWVRFWQDKPQHWGPPPAVKSPVDLADANIQRNGTSPYSKPPTGITSAHPVAARSGHASETRDMHASKEAAGTAAYAGGSSTAAESSAADVAPVLASDRVSRGKQDAAHVTAGQSSAPVTAVPLAASPWTHASFEEAAPTNTAVSGASKSTSVPVSAAAAAAAGADANASADASAAPAKPAGKQAAFNMYSPSKGTLQVLRKPPSKEPTPRKQVPLDQLLAKQAAQAQAEGPGTSSSEAPWQQQQQQQQQQHPQQHPQQTSMVDVAANPATTATAQPVARVVLPHAVQPPAHSHQLAKLQGLTLSQIDASVFAALPAGHQQELLHNLPKTTTRASGAAPVESKELGAGDFAFITKLANLQKGGQARSSSALDRDTWKATECGQRGSPENSVAAAQGTDIPVESFRGEGVDSGLTATSLGSAKQAIGAPLPPPVDVMPLSGQAAAAKVEEDAVALPVSPSDPAFISQLSADSAAVHAASHASPSVVDAADTTMDAQPTASQDHAHTGRPAMSAQQAQHAQQAHHAQLAQRAAQSAATADAADAAAGNLEDYDMGQALDMDLMEEEWAALAAQGQHAAPDNRQTLVQPPTAASAPLHHSLPQQGSGTADSDSPAKRSDPLHASSAAGIGQQQMQGWRAVGMHQQQQQQQAVSALPPASQIDASVLDALPLQVRRELELAYGLAPKRSPGRGVKRRREGARPAAPMKAVQAKKQRLLEAPSLAARPIARLAAHSRMTVAELTYTQLDPAVLSELPQDLRDELAAMLPPSSRTGPHSKAAASLMGRHPAGSNPASAHAHLLGNGRHLGNKAILQQQQQQQHDLACFKTDQAKGVALEVAAVDEPATELWSELQLALEGLSAATKACTELKTVSIASHQNGEQEALSEEKFDALSELVLQWAHRQTESNLEDVHYLLRRLVAHTAASDVIRLGVARLVKAIQQQVKLAHGAKLHLRQPLD